MGSSLTLRFQWDTRLLLSEILISTPGMHESPTNQKSISLRRATAADFTWSTGAISLCYATVESRLRQLRRQTPLLTGPATKTIFDLLDRTDRVTERQWPTDMLGWKDGNPTIFSLFQKAGRRGEPAIELAPNHFKDLEIIVICDDIDITMLDEALSLLSGGLATLTINRKSRRANTATAVQKIFSDWKKLKSSLLLSKPVSTNETEFETSEMQTELQWNIACRLLPNNSGLNDIADLLLSVPTKKLLVVGPGGIGKSTLLQALSDSLHAPLLTLRYQKRELKHHDVNSSMPLLCDGLENVYFAEESSITGHRQVENILVDCLSLENPACVAVRSEFLNQYIDESLASRFHRVQITPWRASQTEAFLGQEAYGSLDEPLRALIAVPFYATTYKSIVNEIGVRKLKSRYAIVETFIANAISKHVRQFGGDRKLVYDSLMSFALKIRKQKGYLTDTELGGSLEIARVPDLTALPFLERTVYGLKFTHDLFGEFMIARWNLVAIRLQQYETILDEFQTTFDEDLFVAEQLEGDSDSIEILENCFHHAKNGLLAVNALGILAKIESYRNIDKAIHHLAKRKDVRARYEQAVKRRVLRGSSLRIRSRLVGEIKSGVDPIAAFFCLRWYDGDGLDTLIDLASDRHDLSYQNLLSIYTW